MKRNLVLFTVAVMAASCGSGQNQGEPFCGDEIIQVGEECDTSDLAGKTCVDLGFGGGVLACSEQCTFDTSGCIEVDDCGNGRLDFGEECEPEAPVGWTCTDLGFSRGETACTSGCRLDASACEGCTDDSFEDNDTAEQAAPLGEGRQTLWMCNTGGEEDWFSISLSAGEQFLIEMNQLGAAADLDIQLIDQAGLVRAESAQVLAPEEILFQAEEDGRYLLRVFPYDGRPGALEYTLGLAIDPECRESSDCLPGEVCRENACQSFTCSATEPCPGGLICDGGNCVECLTAADCPESDAYLCRDGTCIFDCQEDSYEPNSTYDEAAPIAVGFNDTALTLCGAGDTDWFQVDLLPRRLYRLDLSFLQAQGDIDVEVYPDNDLRVPLAVGLSDDDNEQVDFAVGDGEDGTYLVAVRLGFRELAQTYSISLTDQGEVECLEDGDCAGGEICRGYYCTTYECLVDTDCAQPRRCVELTCVDPPPGDSCPDAIIAESFPFTFEVADVRAYRDAVAFAPGDCTPAGTPGNDVIFVVSLQAGQRLDARVRGDYDLALVATSECAPSPAAGSCLAGSDQVASDREESLSLSADQAMAVYLVVDTYVPNYPPSGGFQLTLEIK